MSTNLFGHLTVRQLEQAEDYLGVTLDDVERAPKLRLSVMLAWARLLRDDPTMELSTVRDLPLDRIRKLTDDDPGPGLGET